MDLFWLRRNEFTFYLFWAVFIHTIIRISSKIFHLIVRTVSYLIVGEPV